MQWFKNLKVSARLIGGFVVVALIAGIIGYEGITSLRAADDSDTVLFEKCTQPLGVIGDIATLFQRQRVNILEAIIAKDNTDRNGLLSTSHQRVAEIKERFKEFEKTLVTDEGRKLTNEIKSQYDEFNRVADMMEQLMLSGKTDQALAMYLGEAEKARNVLQKSIEDMVELKVKIAKDRSDLNTLNANSAQNMMLTLVVIGVLLAIGLGLVISRSVTTPLSKLTDAADKLSVGNVEVEIEQTTKDELGILMGAFSKMIASTREQAAIADSISNGEVEITVHPRSEKDVLAQSFGKVISTLQALIAEATVLSRAAIDGKLSTRGNTNKFKGGYQQIVQGVNDTLDAVIGPLNVAAEYVDRISKGDIPNKIFDNYNGDFNEIKNNLNGCINAVNSLVADATILAKAAVDGKLATRADANKHQGDFRKIVQGVNDTLDSVIGPLNVAAEYVDRISKGDIPKKITDNYKGDFNEIKNNLNGCIEAVDLLVTDAGLLVKAAVEGKLATRADASKHQGDFRKIVQGVNDTLDSVIGPLNVAAEYVDRISKGDIPNKITDSYYGDFNEIKNNLNSCIDAVNGLVADAAILSKAAVEGKLATRADASKHHGDFRKVVQGVNNTLDSVIGPLNVAAEYVDRISKGDIPNKISDSYNGDFNEIKNNLNGCIDAVNLLVTDAGTLVKAAVEGKLATRADASKHQGDFRKVVQGVNNTLDSVIGPLNVAAEYVDRISKGDIPNKISDSYNGDFNEIKNNLNGCIDAVNALVADAGILSKAAVQGKLATRADASKHQGDFRKVVQGVNDTLDSVIGPLNVAAEYVDRISKGDIPNKISDSYNGDFNEIKNNLNGCIDAVNALVADALVLSKAAVEGKLATRADASKHQGDFRKIVQGVNETLDSVIGPLNVAAEYVDRISKGDIPGKITDKYNGDFNEIKNNLNGCIDAVNALVADAGGLVKAAVEGKLATRADATKHQGDFRKIVQGVNETLDSVIGPLNVAAEYVDRIAKGDIPSKITDKYNGDFNEIKNHLNGCIDAVNLLVTDAGGLVKAAVEGKLATRADATKHQGDFRKIVQGVNETLDSVIGPLNVAAEYVDRISIGDIPNKITDNYNGDFNAIKNNLNVLIEAMTEITNVAEEVASGNLMVTVKERSQHDKLMQALDVMIKQIRDVVENVKIASDNVASGSKELSQSSDQMSQGATEQAAAAEEASSSMEQMTSNIKQNADNAEQTEKIALKSSVNAKEGGKAVTETAEAMREIAGKISIIEEIARQTNLLALNAAIEAARAGEHGKGFAVVASEVRKLAERSQTAAAEINKLSASSIKVAENAGEMLKKIVPDIQKTSELVQEITASSNEQNSGSEQINSAIQQLNQVIQQNASTSEGMATIAGQLLSQAEQLQESISFFKIDDKRDVREIKRVNSSFSKHASSGEAHKFQTHHLIEERTGAVKSTAPKSVLGKSKKSAGGSGFTIDMSGKDDKLDQEFEKF